jgi:hypothetical protein
MTEPAVFVMILLSHVIHHDGRQMNTLFAATCREGLVQ